MQRSTPYCSRSYEHGRDVLVAAVRDAIDERGLTKADVLVPQDAPKETVTTRDGMRGKTEMAKAIRSQADRRKLDQNSVRQVYAPMRKDTWNQLLRPGEEFRFSVNRLLLICDAIDLEVDFIVRPRKSRA